MKIFVVSLKSATDRRKQITDTMKKLGLEFEFFDAVDGRKGLPKKYEAMIDRELTKKRFGEMSDGEYACALSHGLLYKKIASEKIKNVIVLEDDAIINEDFTTMIKNKLCEKSGCDFIPLNHTHTAKLPWGEREFLGKYKMIKIARMSKSTAGYYINLNAVKYMAQNTFPISYTADWGVNLMHLNVRAIYPRIVKHPKIEYSSLEQNRKKPKVYYKQFGFLNWLLYQLKKPFITKVCNKV